MSLATDRRRLLTGVALMLLPVVSHAQTAPAPAPAPASSVDQARDAQGATGARQPADAVAASPAEAQATDVVVTGSRIARPDYAAPNPITSFNAAAIQQSGNTNITNFLERVPALSGSVDNTQSSGGNAVSRQTFGGAGINELNLRNLGTNRTLVLVDGRRHVAGAADTAAVDVNSIPTDLIDRVDVLTGSASSIYGADGVSGVVNFILKRDFDGVSARTQLGISDRGDAAQRFFSLAAGRNFADGRGNLTLAVEHSEENRLDNDDRSYLQQNQRQYLIPNDNPTAANPYHNILVGNLRYPNESPISAVDVNGAGTFDFNGLGLPYRHGMPASYYSTGNSDDTPVAGFYSGDLTPQINRTIVNLLSHYDVSDALKISVEAKYARVRATTFDYYNSLYGYNVALDNPLVPASILAAAGPGGSILVNRDNIDYGRHGESDLRQTYRGVFDVSGRLTDHATYDAYYEYGRTDVGILKINELLADRYYAALDVVRNPATGALVCRSSIDPTAATATGAKTFTPGPNSGCLPVSAFAATPSQQALDFFRINDSSSARVTEQVASASISGDFGALFRFPGGPLQFAFGGEYRRETSRFDPSVAFADNLLLTYNEPGNVAGTGGSFDVKEGFTELNAPLIQGRRLAETLSAGASYRYSYYSTSGHTNTWQFNGVYAPVRDITFRGSYGNAVRAPNIGELFAPATGSSAFITDPCTPQELGHGTQYRAANCTALLNSLNVPASGRTLAALQNDGFVFGTSSGNPALKPETARTWTAGLVLRPQFAHGFTVSFDWYDINLKNAINQPDPNSLVTLCVDQATLNNPFCGLVTRAQGTGRVTSFIVQPQNVAAFRTAGADLNLDYLLHTARAGTFDLRLIGGYLNRLDFVALPGAVVTDNVDQFGQPRFNANFSPTWTIAGFTLSYNLRWFDKTRTTAKLVTDNDPLYAAPAQLRYSALWQHDVQVGYEVSRGASFYLGVTNLTDQQPDPGNAINAPISAIGRYLYAGVKLRTGTR